MMSVTESELKQAAVAPRVTLEYLESQIVGEFYFSGLDGVLGRQEILPNQHETDTLKLQTFCVLVLKNGFTAHGHSACAAPENFNAAIGERLARQSAVNSIWPLLGYELRTRLALVDAATPSSSTELKTFIGTKVIHSCPMTLGRYNQLRGWVMPANEDPNAKGYLVEYADGVGKPNLEGYVGYVSWSPKAVFEKSYSSVGHLSQGEEA